MQDLDPIVEAPQQSPTPPRRIGDPTHQIVLTKTITLALRMTRMTRSLTTIMTVRFFKPEGHKEDGEIFLIPVLGVVHGQMVRTGRKFTLQSWSRESRTMSRR